VTFPEAQTLVQYMFDTPKRKAQSVKTWGFIFSSTLLAEKDPTA
jgi:hypothetical protein